MNQVILPHEYEQYEAGEGPWVGLTPAQEVAFARRLLDANANQELERFLPFLLPVIAGAAKLALPAAAKLALPALKGVGKMAFKGLARSALKGLGKNMLKNVARRGIRSVGRQAMQGIRTAARPGAGPVRRGVRRPVPRPTLRPVARPATPSPAYRAMMNRAAAAARQAPDVAPPDMLPDAPPDTPPDAPIDLPVEPADIDDTHTGAGDEELSLRVARQLVRTMADATRRVASLPPGPRSRARAGKAVLAAVRAQAPDVLQLLRATPLAS